MSLNSWKVSVWCCTSHRGILERYFWRRWQVSIIKCIRSVWHFGRTFALFTDNCKDIPQCFTLKSIWDSPVWPLSQHTKLNMSFCRVWKTAFLLFLQHERSQRVHFLREAWAAGYYKAWIISSTSFPLNGVNKMSCHKKPAKWCSHQYIHINSHMGNEKLFLRSHCFCI